MAAFIAEDRTDAALKALDALAEAFELLAFANLSVTRREDLTDHALKFLSVFSHLVVYDLTYLVLGGPG